jgi:histidyl-tRNA synthetase
MPQIRGTHTYIDAQAKLFRHIENIFTDTASCYGCEPVIAAILEEVATYTHSLGDNSDIVSKEMFKVGSTTDDIVLRPEGTAGIVRKLVDDKLYDILPQRFAYSGAMFRYERPQKGRYRQFHQVGVEFVGSKMQHKAFEDVECISCAASFLTALGLENRYVLEINTLGDSESRHNYRQQLVEYLAPYKSELSQDSQKRLASNPLRILDSKDLGDIKILATAPQIQDYLTDEARAFFTQVLQGLELLNISYNINPKIVRGLDYYSHTAFEFVATDQTLGAQATILAGGRYDGLFATLGGKSVGAVGWAAGVERLMLMLEQSYQHQHHKLAIVICPFINQPDDEQQHKIYALCHKLRRKYIATIETRGNISKRLKRAKGYDYMLIIGDRELSSNQITLKNLNTGEQQTCDDNIIAIEKLLI